MKTAVSIPDDLFHEADRLARRKKKSRSEIYKLALQDYVARNDPDALTDAMNRACAEVGGAKDDFASRAAQKTFAKSRMVISQGEIWWAELPEPAGSGPGLRRPVVIVQCDSINRSNISTVVCIPLTGNLRWAPAPGNVLLPADLTGLPKDSVVNVSQVLALDKSLLKKRTGRLSQSKVHLLMSGIDVILGR